MEANTVTLLPEVQSPEATRVAIRSIFRLAERWELSRGELAKLLGIRSTSTLDNWKTKPPNSLGIDTLERISYLLHIYRSLRQLFPRERADTWPRRVNSEAPFLGRSALEFMLQGRVQHLLDVHRYLKGAAVGGF